ncbi:MAG: InlB B-repeat-containing protein [Spirochaetales bacterium]|nr:InlB B-repeat-containing protein [Spirochaetales bacterium]
MKKTNYGKTNYGTIVLTIIGLFMCVGCSQVSFNNPFGESEPARTNVDTADNTADNQDASSDDQTDKSKPVEHKIHYLNTNNAVNPNVTSFKETDVVVLKDVSADGFTFDGWYVVTDNIADTSTDGWNAGSKTADVTLWAKWTAINNDPTDPIEPITPTAKVYTIKFGNNAGSGTMTDITADVGATITLPTCTFCAPAGKKFGCWNVKSDGTDGINYADCASVKNLAETDGEVVTLYAQWIDKEAHRIIYQNIKNADNSSNPTYFMESESVALADVTTDGYTFDGWYDSSTDGTIVSGWSAGERTDDVSLWAKWTANEVTYTVKRYFQNVSGSGYDATADIVKSGLTEAITDVTADTVTGFTALPIVQQSVAADGSTVVSVYYDRKVVVYIFNANGGRWNDDSNVKKAVGLYGAEVETTANPSRVGYSFNNWDAEVPAVFGETAETWTAQWTANSYTIVFDANGGTGTMNSMDMTYGTAKTLTANSFTKTGYTFLGWSDSSSDISAQYTNSQSISNLTIGSGEIVTLYAIWKANTYNVVFNANGGSGVMANQAIAYNVTTNLNTNAFYRTGYTFSGWATSASGTKVVYDDAASVSNLTEQNSGIVILYAIWYTTSPTVGYICYEDNGEKVYSNSYLSGKTPIGIVFEVGAKVKIVHLSEETSKKWCLPSADGYNTNPATSTSDGSGNWQIICDAVSDEGTAGNYPAFEYVIGLGSGWYLPAKNELNAVYTNMTAINTALKALSNAGVSVTSLGRGYYWSSSSSNNGDVWCQEFDSGSQSDTYKDNYRLSVRAIRAF